MKANEIINNEEIMETVETAAKFDFKKLTKLAAIGFVVGFTCSISSSIITSALVKLVNKKQSKGISVEKDIVVESTKIIDETDK